MPEPGYVAVRNWDRPSRTAYTNIESGSAVVSDPPSTNSVSGRIENYEWPDEIFHGNRFAFFKLAIGTPQIEVHVVPLDICQEQSEDSASLSLSRACVPEASLGEVGGIKSLGLIPDYAHQYRGRGDLDNGVEFKSLLGSGQWAPPGRYKFVARALGVLGDPENAAHWEV